VLGRKTFNFKKLKETAKQTHRFIQHLQVSASYPGALNLVWYIEISHRLRDNLLVYRNQSQIERVCRGAWGGQGEEAPGRKCIQDGGRLT
jgi:hypothetical protein